MFDSYNEFVKIVFIQRASYEESYKKRLPILTNLVRKLGLILPKGWMLPSHLKSRENSNYLKEKLVNCWCRILNQSNIFESEIPTIFNSKIND
jgi:hypothetical protein